MKIVYLAAGAAGMYCGSCLHDNTLAAALLAAGEDVTLVPTYTSLRTDEADVSEPGIFFGGINVYLQQHSGLFRRTPRAVDALLDRPSLIRLATKWGPGVDPARLGDLTVSMLLGEQGRQKKELERLVAWLATERPDIVHLSNAMLLGMAREIARLGTTVVCSLSGEDIFLERLREPFYRQARQALAERARDVRAFVAMNRYYADTMTDYLEVPGERVHVVPHGLNLEGHATQPPTGAGDSRNSTFEIGFLARICDDKGLHILVEAAERLLDDAQMPRFRVRAAGYLARADRPYLRALEKRTAAWPPGQFQYLGEVSRQQKIEFLQSLDILCLPPVYRESKGIPGLEALANGVPLVAAAHGAFPEMVHDTGGGILFEPGDAADLARAIKGLALDAPRRQELARQGHAAVRARYSARQMAENTRALYRRALALGQG